MAQPSEHPARPVLVSPHDRRRIAVSAACHPDCVVAYMRGEPLRSTTIGRIERALQNLGFEHLAALRTAKLPAYRSGF